MHFLSNRIAQEFPSNFLWTKRQNYFHQREAAAPWISTSLLLLPLTETFLYTMVAPRLIASLLSSPNQFSCNVNGAKSGSFYLIRDVTVVSTFPSILSTAGNLLALPTASVALLQDAVASDFLLQWSAISYHLLKLGPLRRALWE